MQMLENALINSTFHSYLRYIRIEVALGFTQPHTDLILN